MTTIEAPPGPPERSPVRRMFGQIIIIVSLGLAIGALLKTPILISANDISRWCTVWSLLERGTYAIDECPWQVQTQDKVWMKEPFPPAGQTPRKRFYSSKPPLLPTMIAGALYPFRALSGVPLDATIEQKRTQRLEVQSLDYEPTENQKVVEVRPGYKVIDVTPTEPYKWPAQVLYFEPILFLFNVVPLAVFLVLYARLLDRFVTNDWAWFFSLAAAAFGTNLFAFTTTLNNHTIAAYSAFFALYAWLRIWRDERPTAGCFLAAGFFGAFTACNELPAAALGVLLFLSLVSRYPRQTLTWFVPAALVPLAGFFLTLYLATGLELPYSKFNEEGPDAPYRYPGSYWLSPLGADALNEPKPLYAFHLVLGHHGIFSLTPIFLFAFWGLVQMLARRGRERRLAFPALMTLAISLVVIGFYIIKTNNYGGSTQGARWLFWLFPLWLVFLPFGVEAGQERRGVRAVGLLALFFSALNSGYGVILPWSHPWVLDLLEHLGQYTLVR